MLECMHVMCEANLHLPFRCFAFFSNNETEGLGACCHGIAEEARMLHRRTFLEDVQEDLEGSWVFWNAFQEDVSGSSRRVRDILSDQALSK